MRYAIIYSEKDMAGKNIALQFKELGFLPHVPIIGLKKETIFTDVNMKKFPQLRGIDFIVFASQHRSQKGMPSLAIHAPGNWRAAEYGGKEGNVCLSSAFIFKYLFQQLEKNMKQEKTVAEKYLLTMEATHHGPVVELPCIFIELGSNETQWSDLVAARVLAQTIFSLEKYAAGEDWVASFAVGGPHYAPNFNALQLRSKYALSHIIPSYSFPLTSSILSEAEKKTTEQVQTVLIDWKGCGNAQERDKTISLIEKRGFKVVRAEHASQKI